MDKSKDSLKQLNVVGWVVFVGTLSLTLVLYWITARYLPRANGLAKPKEKGLNELLVIFGLCVSWIVEFTFLQKLLARFGVPIFRASSEGGAAS